MKSMMLLPLLITGVLGLATQDYRNKMVVKNEMKVSWYYEKERIFIEMSAPTDGWIAIGFNTHLGTKGAYLLMGNVISGQLSVEEHYTLAPGIYKPITTLGARAQVADVNGMGNAVTTLLRFSLPIQSKSKYQKDLKEGARYTMIMAYSQEEDFQHHSMMRTSLEITL